MRQTRAIARFAVALLASVSLARPVVAQSADQGATESRREEAAKEQERESKHAESIAVQEAESDELSATIGPHGAATRKPTKEEIEPSDLITGSGVFQAMQEGVDTEAIGVRLRLYWTRGINYRVEDELTLFDYKASLDGRIGLRVQADAAGYASNGIEGARGGINLRRLFFYTTGELDLAYPVLFALDLGLQKGSFFVDDAYLWVTDLPWVGTFKIGQFKAPMSLSHLNGSGTRAFMEIGTPAEAFSPGSKAGFQIANDAYDRSLTWQLGWFADSQAVPVGDASSSVTRIVGRITGLPKFERWMGDQELLHIGLSASWVFSSEQRVRYRSRPESFLAPTVVDTGEIDASSATLLGLEAAWVEGPLSFQSEFLGTQVRTRESSGNPLLYGLYAQVSLFLTDDARPFNRASAVFGNVVPKRPLTWDDPQLGAWEVAGRVSWTDLTEGEISGGEIFTLMTGINWYWSRYGRFMFEYGYSTVGGGGPQAGGLHIFQARFQLNV